MGERQGAVWAISFGSPGTYFTDTDWRTCDYRKCHRIRAWRVRQERHSPSSDYARKALPSTCEVRPAGARLRGGRSLDWIAKRIAEAQEAAPVEATAVSLLEAELNQTMRERGLRNAELADLARRLIAATRPQSTDAPP